MAGVLLLDIILQWNTFLNGMSVCALDVPSHQQPGAVVKGDRHALFLESDAKSLKKDAEMSQWTVEIDDDLLNEVQLWSRDRQLELFAIQTVLANGGPEAMGLVKAELEGVPNWHDLSGFYCLPLSVHLPSGWKVLTLEVQPNFRVVVVRLE